MDHRRDVQTLPAQKAVITKSLAMPALVLCLLLGLMLSVAWGVAPPWGAHTLPQRLVSHPGIAWSLIALLTGLQWLRCLPPGRRQAVAGVLLCVIAWVAAGLSAFYFDPYLCLILSVSMAPLWKASTASL